MWRRRDNLDWLWTERYLVLRGATLMCFKKKGDPSPNRTIFLNRDCFVSEVANPDGKTYYEFRVFFSGSGGGVGREGSINSVTSDKSFNSGR